MAATAALNNFPFFMFELLSLALNDIHFLICEIYFKRS